MQFDFDHCRAAAECLRHYGDWICDKRRTQKEILTLIDAIAAQTGEKVELFNSVLGILQNKEGQVLLLKRRPDARSFPNFYSFPGGRPIDNENLSDTVVRETKEETDLDATVIECHSSIFTLIPDRPRISHVEFYTLALKDDAVSSIQLSDEHTEYLWADPRVVSESPERYGLQGTIILEYLKMFAKEDGRR